MCTEYMLNRSDEACTMVWSDCVCVRVCVFAIIRILTFVQWKDAIGTELAMLTIIDRMNIGNTYHIRLALNGLTKQKSF